ncbi:MAG: PKD domain-containing protein [Muribaculaceae bacterium]|nr:PKD domain-containing protein [Muribaculaceae bacterium]
MFKKFYKGLLLGAITIFAVSCSEDHEFYNTAAKAGIEQMGGEYEVGVPITFKDTSVPTEGTRIVSYFWEFGDEDNSTSTEMTPTFTYKKDGTYTVKLTVEDSNELKASTTTKVVIVNPTKADFELDQEEYLLGDVVNFKDISTTKGSTTIVGWFWEFADENRSTSTEQNPSFKYQTAGSYPVKLTVTDSYGLTASVTKSVNILDPTMIIATQWTMSLGGAVKAGSSPAMSPDGSTLYMMRSKADTDLAALYAYDSSSGQVKWTLDLSEAMQGCSPTATATDVFSSPSVGADGTIYMIVRDLQSTSADRVGPVTIAVNPNGSVKWAKANGAGGTNLYAITPAIDTNGNILVATRGNEMWKYTPDGACTIFSTEGIGATAGISVSKSGVAYAAANGKNGFFATDINSGAQLWKYTTNLGGAADAFTGALRSAQASIGADGTIYFVTDADSGGGEVIALNANGSTSWIYKTAGAIPDGGVAIGEDGTLYANGGTSAAEGLIALDKNGNLLWNFATKANVQTTPTIDDRGYIHIIDAQANYYVVKQDGTLFAEDNLGQSCTSTPVMDATGRLYVAVIKDGVATMVCVSSKASSYNTVSAWPMRGQNPSRTSLQK